VVSGHTLHGAADGPRPSPSRGGCNLAELISVHIPKTAGESFLDILRQVYGRALVCDYGGAVRGLDRARVVHGHFPVHRYRARWPEASLVTWMRDPVERVTSLYYYWLGAAPHGNPNHDRFLAERPSLIEFARTPELQSEVGQYLQASAPSDFLFVGFVDRFDADVQRLARLLDWPPIDIPHRNATARPAISAATRRLLAQTCRAESGHYRRMREAWRV
jgi:hypothetical protein